MAIVEHICRPELFSTLGDPFLNSFRNLHSIYRLSDIMLRNYLRQQRKELVSDRETLQQLGHIAVLRRRVSSALQNIGRSGERKCVAVTGAWVRNIQGVMRSH